MDPKVLVALVVTLDVVDKKATLVLRVLVVIADVLVPKDILALAVPKVLMV